MEKNSLVTKCNGFVSMEDCRTRVNCDCLFECEDYLQAENDECNKRTREVPTLLVEDNPEKMLAYENMIREGYNEKYEGRDKHI